MAEDSREHFVLLTESGVRDPLLHELQRNADCQATATDLKRTLLAQALAGDATVRDCCPEVGLDEVRAATRHIRVVECPGRFYYPWILIDLAVTDDARRDVSREAIRKATERERGLVLALDETYEANGAAEVVSANDVCIDSTLAFVQYIRATLKTIPPCRVLFVRSSDAELFADSLSRHEMAVLVTAEPRSQRTPRRDWLATLRKLAANAPSSREAETAGIVGRPAAFFFPPDDIALRQHVRTFAPRAVSLPWTSDAVASFLSDWQPLQQVQQEVAPVIAVAHVDLTDRGFASAPRRVLYTCVHLLGDALNATPILRQHRLQYPDDHLTFLVPDKAYARVFELSPDVDRIGYLDTGGQHDIVFGSSSELIESLPYRDTFDESHALDIQQVARDPEVRGRELHMACGYAHRLGRELEDRRPSLDAAKAREHSPPERPRGRYAVFARHSVSGQIGPNDERTKRWSESKWRNLARRIHKEYDLDVVSIGSPSEQPMRSGRVIDMHDLSIREVAGLLANASLLVCVDNGIFHLGQAMGCPVVHLVPEWLGASWTARSPDVPGRDVVASLPSLSIREVFEAVDDVLSENARDGSHA